MPDVTPIAIREEDLATVKYDHSGLVPAIVQEEGTGDVLMMAWMNETTLRRSLEPVPPGGVAQGRHLG